MLIAQLQAVIRSVCVMVTFASRRALGLRLDETCSDMVLGGGDSMSPTPDNQVEQVLTSPLLESHPSLHVSMGFVMGLTDRPNL